MGEPLDTIEIEYVWTKPPDLDDELLQLLNVYWRLGSPMVFSSLPDGLYVFGISIHLITAEAMNRDGLGPLEVELRLRRAGGRQVTTQDRARWPVLVSKTMAANN